MEITQATAEDAAAILALQRLAYQSEAEVYGDFSIPPLTQTLKPCGRISTARCSSRPWPRA